MCVAALLYTRPKTSDIECMFDHNPHGAGFAYQHGDTLRIVRGLMTVTDLLRALDDEPIVYPALLHFRWATHGGQIPELTHPFPTGVQALMGELDTTSDQVLIHNGTWANYSRYIAKIVDATKLPHSVVEGQSDTAIAAFLARDDEALLENVYWATAISKPSKHGMCTTLRGTWYTHEGNLYSNLSWVGSSGRWPAWMLSGGWSDDYEPITKSYTWPKENKTEVVEFPSDDEAYPPGTKQVWNGVLWEMGEKGWWTFKGQVPEGDLVSEDPATVNAAIGEMADHRAAG
jgi:hypothetical protein